MVLVALGSPTLVLGDTDLRGSLLGPHQAMDSWGLVVIVISLPSPAPPTPSQLQSRPRPQPCSPPPPPAPATFALLLSDVSPPSWGSLIAVQDSCPGTPTGVQLPEHKDKALPLARPTRPLLIWALEAPLLPPLFPPDPTAALPRAWFSKMGFGAHCPAAWRPPLVPLPFGQVLLLHGGPPFGQVRDPRWGTCHTAQEQGLRLPAVLPTG